MEMNMFTWQWIHWTALKVGSKNTDDADLPGSKAQGTEGQGARTHSSPHPPPPSSSSPFTSQQSSVELCGLIRAAHANREEEHVERVSYLLYIFLHPFPLTPLLIPLSLLKSTFWIPLPGLLQIPENNREYERLKLRATVSTAVQQYRNTSSLGPHPFLRHPTVSLWHLGCFVTKAPSTHRHTCL